MSIQRIILVMLLFFFSEGTLFYWLLPDNLVGRVVPHFVLAFVLLAGMYRGRHSALLLGFFFGLLHDIAFYGRIIGLDSFTFALVGYLCGLLLEGRRSTLLMALTMIAFFTFLYETIIHYIYRVFKLTTLSYEWAIFHHILPSLFLQLLFALLMYVPARRWFEGSLKKKKEDEEE
ncbi:rod shape-determining protein MreD [Paenibacillus nasutitermitis]|uniref:Rod shape-determining protein MreD n=1 Tax=Paenibacillus nasutitermitis TaxID=1652958 RepID=A0A916YPS1_9BACL|nr:rod shape-determining protein MreD [Paenibacillus nasutitermitis]GGD54609.1 hypothetical protein GCM10010911_10290 [Paenibacillus nasutitermitis]